MKTLLVKAAKVYGALGVAAAAFFIQQALVLYFALENIIPSGLAKTVRLKHGKLILDGTRSVSLWELPIAGIGMFWGSLAGSAIIILVGYFTAGRTLSDLHFRSFSWRVMFPWVLAYTALAIITTVLENYFPAFKSESMTTMIQASRNDPVLAIVGIGLAVPFFEEIVFRGWLFKRMELTFGPIAAVLSTSVLFTLIHIQYNGAILSVLFLVALILGMMRSRTGSIWPSIIIHCLNNTIATLMAFSQM